MTISFNPFSTTNGGGLFGIQSDGYVQGVALDDPASRNYLAGGTLAGTETLPMFGGVAITELIPTAIAGTNGTGGSIKRATALANITGFSVFNQQTNGVITTSSNVPLLANGQTVNFFRFGSHARVAVKCDPTLVGDDGLIISTQVSWDYANQQLIAYDGTNALPVKVLAIQANNCKTVTYDAGTGFANFNPNGACALILL